MKLPEPHEGFLYVRRKATGQVVLIPEHLYKPDMHDKVTDDGAVVSASTVKGELPKQLASGFLEKQDRKPAHTKAQLSVLSAKQIKSLPEYAHLKDEIFKSKEALIDACLNGLKADQVVERPDYTPAAKASEPKPVVEEKSPIVEVTETKE